MTNDPMLPSSRVIFRIAHVIASRSFVRRCTGFSSGSVVVCSCSKLYVADDAIELFRFARTGIASVSQPAPFQNPLSCVPIPHRKPAGSPNVYATVIKSSRYTESCNT